MEGWIKLHRKLCENPLWKSEPFSRGQAWVDLLLLANHEGGYFYVRGNKVELNRGQLGYSQVTLADRWQWSRGKVKRFLNELETEQQIEQQNTSVTTLITIVNYKTFQARGTADGTADGTANGQQTEQQTGSRQNSRQSTNKNDKNDNNENNDKKSAVLFSDFRMTLEDLKDKYFEKYPSIDFEYYHTKMAEWSRKDNIMKIDWYRTTENAIKRDIEKGWQRELKPADPRRIRDEMKYLNMYTQKPQVMNPDF